ncbi:MAG: hypothetical protein M3032_01495 [Verrucomicrobiota bacterium]|nr:hypothetical protein [Verrucomicrobiota bacterium]
MKLPTRVSAATLPVVTLRRILAALLFTAIAVAVGLSASPQLHDWLHKVRDQSNHECAATLMSSGNVEHSACEPPPTCREQEPAAHIFRAQPFARVIALLGVARLEHAPPAHA